MRWVLVPRTMLSCVDVYLTIEQDPDGKIQVTLAVADNDFTESWECSYRAGDRSALTEYATDVLSFEATGSPIDINDPGPLYQYLLFREDAWTRLRVMRQALAGRARIRFLLSGDPEVVDLMWEAAPIPRLSGGIVSLGRDDDVSLVRVIDGTARRAAGMTSTRVLVATATDLSGRHLLPSGDWIDLGAASGPPPRDVDRIRETLGKIGYDVDAPAEVTRSSLGAKLSSRHYAFVFCGHHVTTPSPGLVVHASEEEATADLLDDHWLAALLGGAPPGIAVLVACDSGGPVGSYGSLARRLAAAGVPLVVGVYGTLTHHDAEEFVATFFEELVRGSPADMAAAKARTRFRVRYVLPVVYAHGLPDLRQQAPAPRLPEAFTFRAWALPAGWSPRTPLPLSEDCSCRLDLLCTLDRGPVTVVLADSRAWSLADSLNAAEDVIQREAVRQRRSLVRRAWHEYDAANGIPETLDDWLRLAGHPVGVQALLAERGDGANLGLVVKVHAPSPHWPHGGEWAQLIARFAAFRDTELRAAALVLRVVADMPIDAILGAADIAGRMARHESDLLCRVLPWNGPAVPLHGTGAGAFRAAIAGARQRRGLSTRPLAGAGGGPTSATAAAEQLVANPSDRFDDEVALLLDTRDWLPGCYEPLLTAYARHREGPCRYAALVAASGVDVHLDHWLQEAIAVERPPLPVEAPPQALRTQVVEALLWALRRRGARALLDVWLELREGESVHSLVETTRAGTARHDWAAEDPEAVRRWAREVKMTGADLSDADPGLPGWWAALSQLPLKRELAELVLALKGPFPLVAGVRDPDDRTPLDVTDVDLVAVLRRAYHPMRYERA